MSDEFDLAIAIPSQLLLLVTAVLAIVVVAVIVALKKRRTNNGPVATWAAAAAELGIHLSANGSDLGLVAEGKVNHHVVAITPTASTASKKQTGRKANLSTKYSIKFEAPEAPKFAMIKREVGDKYPLVDTGNPKFDAAVAIQTEQEAQLSRYLTPGRRAAILRLFTYWPTAKVSNREAHLFTDGLEKEHDKLVDSICHLVAAAETFDRPTQKPDLVPLVAEASSTIDEDLAAPARPLVGSDPVAIEDPIAAPITAQNTDDSNSDVLTEVRLDELTVLSDLFNNGLTESETDARFKQVYRGRDVSWAGEVLRVGALDDSGRRRIAALVGSADGQSVASGRVVALTAIISASAPNEGDVVSFSGSLVNLDARQRLFHIA